MAATTAGLPDLLREAMARHQIGTQREAAARLGVDQTTFGRWLNGGGIKVKHLPAIADFVGRPLDEVVRMRNDDAEATLEELDRDVGYEPVARQSLRTIEDRLTRVEAAVAELLAEVRSHFGPRR